jgi:H+/Na+-translocating ferredoxin:NAD+ oxidoreductase subunit C
MIKRSFFSLAKPKLTYPVLKSDQQDTVQIPLPGKAQLFLNRPFSGPGGVPIRVGDKVKTGQKIGLGEDGVEYFISPVTGLISRIASFKGYLGRDLMAISFDVEKEDIWDEEFAASGQKPLSERLAEFLGSLPGQRDFASVVGFKPPLSACVIYGIDKDLLVAANQHVVRTQLEDLKQGIDALKQICGECRIILLVPSEYGLQAERAGVEVKALTPVYPDLLPQVIMKRIFGKEVPAGSRCEEMGVGFLSAEAVAGLGRALARGRIPVDKTLTVIKRDGSVVNVKARIGTPVKEILHTLHVETQHGDRLILGGPMTGLAVYSEETPVQADTDALMVQDGNHAVQFADTHCINCGDCVRACPATMPVNMLIRVLENGMYEEAVQTYDLLSCIECGLCSFVCPARIPIFQYVMLGKYEYDRMREAEGSNA